MLLQNKTINADKRKNIILGVILAVSVIVRLLATVWMGNTVVELPGTADQVSYHALSLRVLGGHGFSFGQNWWPATRAGEPTSHWSFLYTFYLVVVYGLFGPNPIIARAIQSILVGILHPYLVYLIGARLMGERTGLVAAGLTAGYGYFIYYAATLMTEPFYITAILAAFWMALRITDSHQVGQKIRYAIGLGLALGCAVLLRQLLLLIIPFFLLWIAWCERKQMWQVLALELVLPVWLVCLVILPFSIYNYSRFGMFVLLNTNSGYALYFGNHPIYGTHFVPLLGGENGGYYNLIPKELLPLSEAALDQALSRLAVQIILADPIRYIFLSLSRVPVYFQFWPSPGSGIVSNISRVASFGILLPFMLYGIIRWGVKKGFQHFSSPSWLMLLFMVVYSGIHFLSWTLIRYRLPVDSILLFFASYAFLDLYSLIVQHRQA